VSKLRLEPLERLDLRKCTTVGDIVLAMSKCSFGARMLGEVAHKLFSWIQEGKRVRVVYDGSELLPTFKRFRDRGWIHEIVHSTEVHGIDKSSFEHLVVGRYSEAVDSDVNALETATSRTWCLPIPHSFSPSSNARSRNGSTIGNSRSTICSTH
jgi:hypothetical protein